MVEKKVTFSKNFEIETFSKKLLSSKKKLFRKSGSITFFIILKLLYARSYERINTQLIFLIGSPKIEIFDFPEILEIFVGLVSKIGGFQIFENLEFWIPY